MLKSVEKLRNHIKEYWTISEGQLFRFLDDIDLEVSTWYMPLPVGSDGVPIRVEEVVLDYDTPRSVVAVTPDAVVIDGYQDGDSITDYNELRAQYIDELRELLGGDAE